LTNSGSESFSGACVLSGSGGTATCSVTLTPAAAGNHNISASFAATTVHSASSDSKTLTVNTRATTTGVSFSTNPDDVNQPTTATVTVTDSDSNGLKSSPTGTVAVSSDSGDTITGICSLTPAGTGISTCQVAVTPNSLGSGTHNITASFSATNVHSASSGSAGLTVHTRSTMTSVSFAIGSVVTGQSTNVTVTVTDNDSNGLAKTPVGTVSIGSSEATDVFSSSTCTLSGSGNSASCTVTVKPVIVGTGSHLITASYPADNVHSASSGSNTLTVSKANTATGLTSSVNPSAFGQSVTFTATVSAVGPGAGTPTGTVAFFDNGNPIGGSVTLSGGVATLTTNALSVGNHTITTTYGGDGNFNGSNGALTGNPQVVNKANTTTVITSVNPEPSILAASYTVKWTVTPAFTGTPGGTVTVNDGNGNSCSAAVSTGQCVIPTSTVPGTNTLTATYSGDGNFVGSSGTANHQVIFASGGTCDGDPGHQILPPINPGNPGTSVFKQGSTVPAKFRVCDANGNSIGIPGVIKAFVLYEINSGTITPFSETASDSTNDLGWRFDPTAQQWIFNMSTQIAPVNKANQTYFFRIDLSDGTSIFFNYGLK
jgi:hypothetical protein